ncbi:MAG: glycosyltransferase, partial [Chthoniobacterales bacterium]
MVHKAVIFFVQQPTWWPEGAASPQPEKIAPILRFALRLLRPLLLEKRAVLATETPVAQEEYRAMTGLDVHLWGHPVEVPARAAQTRTGKTLFSSLGFARHEKGSDILAEALERCLQDPRFDHCEFFLQWGKDFVMLDGSLQTLAQEIRASPRVRVVDGPLNREDYLEVFEQTDAVLLPYRQTSYYGRLSRVSIEAVAAGIPMIASPGTHAAHIVAEQGAGVTMSGLSAGELVESMARFLEAREAIAETAIQRSASARLIHSPDAFVRDLLASIDAGQKPVPSPLGSRTRAPLLMSFREFKFCLKQTLRKGPVFLWWYAWARSLAVSGWRNPWSNLPIEKVPLHVMTGSDQLAMTKCMLISFFAKTRRNWKVVLHDDGTLSEDAVRVLAGMGIQSEYHSRPALLARARQVLADLPLCLRACEETLLAPKFFGPLIFTDCKKMLLIDSDVVFFKEPRELLEWADSESEEMFFAVDRVDRAELLRVSLREKFGIDLWKSVNSGICCLCPQMFKFEETEKFLRELDLLQTMDPWLVEQTLFAI